MIPLWKGKGSPSDPTAYRSIFISNYSTKIFHQWIRRHLVQVWEYQLEFMQYGGRRAGHVVDLAHHLVQCHQHWAVKSTKPNAVLIVDIRSAFYMVLRQAFTDLPRINAPSPKLCRSWGLQKQKFEPSWPMFSMKQWLQASPGTCNIFCITSYKELTSRFLVCHPPARYQPWRSHSGHPFQFVDDRYPEGCAQ